MGVAEDGVGEVAEDGLGEVLSSFWLSYLSVTLEGVCVSSNISLHDFPLTHTFNSLSNLSLECKIFLNLTD